MGLKEKLGGLSDLYEKAKQKYSSMNLEELKQMAREKGILGQSENKGEDQLREDLAKKESQERANQ